MACSIIYLLSWRISREQPPRRSEPDTAPRLSEAQIAEIRARLDKGLPSPWLGDEARHAFIDAAPDDVRALLAEVAALKAERDTLQQERDFAFEAAKAAADDAKDYFVQVQRAESAEAALVALRAQVEQTSKEMRSCPRFKSHPLGFEDSVEDHRVDDWADELDAALLASQPGPATSQEPKC